MSGEVIVAAVGIVSSWVVTALMVRQNRKLSAESDTYQRRLADTEDARLRKEMRPALTMEASSEGGGITLAIRNDGQLDLDHVEVIEIAQAPPVIKRNVRSLVGAFYPLKMGVSQPMSVATDLSEAGGRLVLRLRVKSSSDEWERIVSCHVDGPSNYSHGLADQRLPN